MSRVSHGSNMVQETCLDLAVREHVVQRKVLEREVEQLVLETAHDREADPCNQHSKILLVSE